MCYIFVSIYISIIYLYIYYNISLSFLFVCEKYFFFHIINLIFLAKNGLSTGGTQPNCMNLVLKIEQVPGIMARY